MVVFVVNVFSTLCHKAVVTINDSMHFALQFIIACGRWCCCIRSLSQLRGQIHECSPIRNNQLWNQPVYLFVCFSLFSIWICIEDDWFVCCFARHLIIYVGYGRLFFCGQSTNDFDSKKKSAHFAFTSALTRVLSSTYLFFA